MSLLKQEILKKYESVYNDTKIVFELFTPSIEMFVLEVDPDSELFHEFVLIWGDYVANAWEEKFEYLSQAMARTAQLIHVSEHDEVLPESPVMFTAHGDEFVRAWNRFLKETTETAQEASPLIATKAIPSLYGSLDND